MLSEPQLSGQHTHTGRQDRPLKSPRCALRSCANTPGHRGRAHAACAASSEAGRADRSRQHPARGPGGQLRGAGPPAPLTSVSCCSASACHFCLLCLQPSSRGEQSGDTRASAWGRRESRLRGRWAAARTAHCGQPAAFTGFVITQRPWL